MTPSNNNRSYVKPLFLVAILLLVWLAYSSITALHTIHTTGLLRVATSDKNAIVSISAEDTDAKVVGTGSANVRLRPGTYLVNAVDNGSHASSVEEIKLQQSDAITLTLSSTSLVPSADNINFNGLDALVSKGITAQQVANLRQLFFELKSTAKSITIDTTSVTNGPYDPSSDNSDFSLIFNVSVDNTPYVATIYYSDLVNLKLVLTDPTSGAQLFTDDSNKPLTDT